MKHKINKNEHKKKKQKIFDLTNGEKKFNNKQHQNIHSSKKICGARDKKKKKETNYIYPNT